MSSNGNGDTVISPCKTSSTDPARERNIVIGIGVVILVILLIIVIMFWFKKHTGSGIKWGFTGIFAISLIAFLIWIWVLSAAIGKRECDICNPPKNEDCGKDLYCGGDARCHKGSNGKAKGADCSDTSECDFGLTCQTQGSGPNRCEPPAV